MKAIKKHKKIGTLILCALALIIYSCNNLNDLKEETSTLTSDGFNRIENVGGQSFNLDWRVCNNSQLDIRVTAQTTGWVGIGFNKTAKKMDNSNLIIGYINAENQTAHLIDAYGNPGNKVVEDIKQDGKDNIINPSGNITISNGQTHTTIAFSIPLQSTDKYDVAFSSGDKMHVILAAHSSKKSTDTSQENKHTHRTSTTITLP